MTPDPKKNPKASALPEINYLETAQKQLKVMIRRLFHFAWTIKCRSLFFDLFHPHNIKRVVWEKRSGTRQQLNTVTKLRE